ncbi:hypothetical protein D3C76_738670 [compost metagenome]
MLPRTDQRFGRRHGAPQQNGHGDHHPGGNLVLDHQDGTQAQGQGLPGHAHKTRQRGDPRAAVAGFALLSDNPLLHVVPAPTQGREHAHRLNHFGVLQGTVDVAGRRDGQPVGFAHALACGQFVPDRQPGQDQRTDDGEHSQPRMEQERGDHVDRQPRRIEDGDQGRTGHELADAVQVAQHLRRVGAVFLEAALKGGIEYPLTQLGVQACAHLDHDLAAHPFQRTTERKEPEQNQAQHQQGGFIAAGQDAVEDLHHVDRRDQHQQVDHTAEQCQHAEKPTIP